MAVTDLTGYTWAPNATIEFSNENTYSINYNIVCANTEYNDTNGTTLVFTIRTFRSSSLYNLDINTSNYNIFGGSIYQQNGTIFEGINTTTMSDTRGYGPTYVTEIQFTGGDDATNATLIAWLEANGTLTAPVQPTAKTVINGLTPIKKMFGTTEIIKEVVNGVTVYEKQGSTTINFTILDNSDFPPALKTYSAESGMTWAEWVNSEYNTDGYIISQDAIFNSSVTYYLTLDLNTVYSTDTISGTGYTLVNYGSSGGGGGN